MVCFDADADGDIDLFIQNNSQSARLWRNEGGNARHWLTVRLRQDAPNTQAIGARIVLSVAGRTQLREIQAGNNYLSSNPAEAHFGLGADTTGIALRIRWPDGGVQNVEVTGVDRVLLVQRGSGAPVAQPVTSLAPWGIVLLVVAYAALACVALASRRA